MEDKIIINGEEYSNLELKGNTDFNELDKNIENDNIDFSDVEEIDSKIIWKKMKSNLKNKRKIQVHIRLDREIIDFFKDEAKSLNTKYQTLINEYLSTIVKEKNKLNEK